MDKKLKCKVETNEELISLNGLDNILKPLKKLNKTNYIFEAELNEKTDGITIELPSFLKVYGSMWVSSYKDTLLRKKRCHSFIIVEEKQLEFDF